MLVIACLLVGRTALAVTHAERAQSHVRKAVLALEQDSTENALKHLDKAANAAELVKDAPWRDAILSDIHDAGIVVLTAAAAAKWHTGGYGASYRLYARADANGVGGPLGDEVRAFAARAAHLHMLQIWLSGDEKAARALADVAESATKRAFDRGSTERRALDALSAKISRPRSLEVLIPAEIERRKRNMEAEGPRHPDPRRTYELALLARTLRAFDLAEELFDDALKATKDSEVSSDRSIAIGSREKLDHIRSLTRQVTIRSNVPFYSVELWRPEADLPEGASEAEDATAGVSFTVYPGRYIVKVKNAEYGTCERDDVMVETLDTVARCNFRAPPVVVTLDAKPKGLQARLTPSDMIEWRELPFTLNLMRGRYTLAVKHPKFRAPVDVPVVVSRDGEQTFDLDLRKGMLELTMSKEHEDARVLIDGRDLPRIAGSTVELSAGPHVLEVFKTGFQTFKEHVVVRPQGHTLIAPELVPGVGADETAPPPEMTLTSSVGYESELRDFELEGYDLNGEPNVVRRSYPLHHALAELRYYVSSPDDPFDPRWFVRGSMDLAIATANPVDEMLLGAFDAGGGVQLLSRSGEWLLLHASYRFTFGEWSTTWEDGSFTMNQVRPLGLALGALARVDWLVTELAMSFTMGSGMKRQSTDAAGLSSGDVDLDTAFLRTDALVGVDIIDAIRRDDDLDVVLGPTGFFTWYREQRSDKPSPFQALAGGAGFLAGVSYVMRGEVDTRFTGEVEARFVGDLAPELLPVFDEKTRMDAVAGVGNVSFRAGVEVGF